MIRCKFRLMGCSRVQGQGLPDCDKHMLSRVTSKMSEGYIGHHSPMKGQGFNSLYDVDKFFGAFGMYGLAVVQNYAISSVKF